LELQVTAVKDLCVDIQNLKQPDLTSVVL